LLIVLLQAFVSPGAMRAYAQVNGVPVSGGIVTYGQLWGGQTPGSLPGAAQLEFWMSAEPAAAMPS